jgi:hypothetical protein
VIYSDIRILIKKTKIMFKRIVTIVLFIGLIIPGKIYADEGMWLLSLIKKLNEADMQKLGCKLTADQIYSINNSSLKDAFVSLGGFCTAEMISKDGLLITNHHCGLEAVQAHTSPEHDYLTNGFWAKTREEELSNPDLFVKFLIRMEDVTDKVKKELSDTLNEAQFQAALPKIYSKITKAATDSTDYTAEVKSMFKGDEFYLFVYQTFKDVRLVGAPPYQIGDFGGDTDNWMWPRHTGDFSMFRVYCSKDGKPADYSKDNVPYTPKYFLPISLNGAKKDDYAMILGYPGATDRYLTSAGVEMAVEVTNPAVVKIRDKKLEIIEHDMKADDAVRIKYQAKHNESSNYWKYFIGQTKQLKRMRVADQKKELESKFTGWANADAARKSKYSNVTEDLKNAYTEDRKIILTRTYLSEAIFQGAEILPLAFGYQASEKILENKEAKPEEIKAAIDPLKAQLDEYFKNYNIPTDKKLLAALLKMYYTDIPKEQQAPIFKEIESKYNGDFDKYAEKVFDNSIFTAKEKLAEFLSKPSAKKLNKDLAYKTVTSIMDFYTATLRPQLRAIDQKLAKLNRAYIKGTREMFPDRKFAPDANSTMRLSYGTVKDYDPMDAVQYNYYTTIEGIMEKMDDKFDDYKVPAKLVELYKKKDYGRYADNGEMKVCFTTTNDITGGNSGSGVLNGNGELIGLAFDGNWEAMSGDIAYDPTYKRTIVVDIRYVLFIIDKYAGASNLINEMKIVGAPTAAK